MGVIQSPPQKGGLAGINLTINQFQRHRSLLWGGTNERSPQFSLPGRVGRVTFQLKNEF
jgi:hypothetical protein